MADGNGYNKTIIAIGTAVGLVAGGGGGAFAGNASARAEVDKLDDRLTQVERKQDVVIERLDNYIERQDEYRETQQDNQEEILEALRGLE